MNISVVFRTRAAAFLAIGLIAAIATGADAPQARAQFVCVDTAASAQGATATGSISNFAGGPNANATGTGGNNNAIGTGATPSGNISGNLAVGLGDASGNSSSNTATGNNTNASGNNSSNTATGAGAIASGNASQNIATGFIARANGDGSNNIATGSLANAVGDNSSNIAAGSQASAGGNNSANVATGGLANASGVGSANVAMGLNANASGNGTSNIAVGNSANARREFVRLRQQRVGDLRELNGDRPWRHRDARQPAGLRHRDQYLHDGRHHLGREHGRAVRIDATRHHGRRRQPRLHVAGRARDRQLRRDRGHQQPARGHQRAPHRADGRTDKAINGVAMAFAMSGSPWLMPSEKIAVTANWGTFQNTNALSMSAALRVSEHVQASGGLTYGTNGGGLGGRVGMRVGW